MKSSIASFLLLFYSFGQIVLPEGNFAYLAQIPDLYHEFVALNNDSDVDDFFEEQFFDFDRIFGDENDDDPMEKEAKQVPFHLLPFTAVNFCIACETEAEQTPPENKKRYAAFYLLTEFYTEPASIFHPPKTITT